MHKQIERIKKMIQHNRILFLGLPSDKMYLQRLKPCVGTASVSLSLDPIQTIHEVKSLCTAKHCTAVISTSPFLLEKLVDLQVLGTRTRRNKPSIDNYAGSLFSLPNSSITVLFINPLEQLLTVPYGEFITKRYIAKLVRPESYLETTTFNWSIFDEAQFDLQYKKFSEAKAIAIDIETFSTPPSIRCVGYTALFSQLERGSETWSSESLVIPCDSLYALSCIRQLNSLPIPKIFQNGKYDISYLSMYNAVPSHYFWDTAEMMHSWYSELPKDLASLNSFFVRDSMYWKDLADTNDLKQYYLYNAKDTWATANVFLAWIQEAPQWAKDNYLNTFPLQFPCHLSEMTGIKRDIPELKIARQEQDSLIESKSKSLDTMLGVKGFNTNSPIQMKQVLKVLGCSDLESADAKNLAKASLRHPLNSRIIGTILAIRKSRKLVSTYLTEGKEYHGRILFSLNPHGTDTGRLASKEHHFWCGLQIQNIPRGDSVKRTLVADDGFRIAEVDLEQAESRDTAHIAGDESLIKAVSGTRDFHSVNAAAFFGLPYDTIYDDAKGKTKDKALRDLAKRVNHGANYNMGPNVLVETMGEDKVREASKLLGLPKMYSLKQIAEHLLAAFHKTYPSISRTYYPGVINEIITTSRLSSKAIHNVPDYCQASPSALVRYCFSDPSKSKQALNAYVAHPPQSLNAMTLNRAYMKVFYEIAMHPSYYKHFKLIAQIHDSILFQFRAGHEYLIQLVKDCMEIPVTVTGYDGKSRTFTVPAAAKAGSDGLGAVRWSETE